MNKEDLKKIKVLYYPYKAVKKVVQGSKNYLHYINSLCYIKMNKKRVQEKINNKEVLNVVFVVQYIPGWNKLEPIYSKMKKDDRFNPVIVCVPLNIQEHKLMDNNGNDTYRYFVEHEYEAIDALQEDGSWYDLKRLNPDYLFHSRPYNHFMPEPYTSGKIVKYALICNVLYGPNLTVNGQDVTLNMNYYRDCYCYFAFDNTEKKFYEKRFKRGIEKGIQKCLPYGAIAIEQILRDYKIGSTDGFKKTVMWTPRWSTDSYIGGSTFFKYRNSLKILVENNPDVFFIFRPHPLMFDNFIKTGELSAEEAQRIRLYCEKKENIILDEKKEYAEQFYKSDILISDGSGMLPEYFALNKPVIYCGGNSRSYVQWSRDMISAFYSVNNEQELESVFNALITGKDNMINKRKQIFDCVFGEAKNNSDNIVSHLFSLNK